MGPGVSATQNVARVVTFFKGILMSMVPQWIIVSPLQTVSQCSVVQYIHQCSSARVQVPGCWSRVSAVLGVHSQICTQWENVAFRSRVNLHFHGRGQSSKREAQVGVKFSGRVLSNLVEIQFVEFQFVERAIVSAVMCAIVCAVLFPVVFVVCGLTYVLVLGRTWFRFMPAHRGPVTNCAVTVRRGTGHPCVLGRNIYK